MATPLYDALVQKVRDWSNKKQVATLPDSVIKDCLKWGADDLYRDLRIPPLENLIQYAVEAGDNENEVVAGVPNSTAYTRIPVPENLTEFGYIRMRADANNREGIVFNEVTDARTFFDAYAEKYSRYNWMYLNGEIYIHPQLKVGDVLEIYYWRRLPDLDATYSVLPINYIIGFDNANQPYLDVDPTGTTLWFAGADENKRAFATEAEAIAYGLTQPITTVTSETFGGKEAPNWLRDQNERMLISAALYHVGAYLFDPEMEGRYEKKRTENITALNREEKMRKAKGGNVRINVNTGGLI